MNLSRETVVGPLAMAFRPSLVLSCRLCGVMLAVGGERSPHGEVELHRAWHERLEGAAVGPVAGWGFDWGPQVGEEGPQVGEVWWERQSGGWGWRPTVVLRVLWEGQESSTVKWVVHSTVGGDYRRSLGDFEQLCRREPGDG